MAQKKTDVVVIGAGPAGSTTAHRLAAEGARVVMLDRARFPRDKPCGGGVTTRGLGLIATDITPVVERTVTDVALDINRVSVPEITSPTPMVYMTQRRRLDAHLMQAAVHAGVEMHETTRVRGIDHTHDGAMVHTDTGTIRAAVVVGADGANGVSRSAIGVPAPVFAVALEGNLPRGTGDFDDTLFQHRAWLGFGDIPGGYAWIFPKGDHVNVGVGGYRAQGPYLRTHLDRVCRTQGIDPDALEGVRGHRLPIRRSGSPVAVGRCVLVGDAAGLVDPFSGDGMYEAFISANIAARHATDLLTGQQGDLSGYPRDLSEALDAHRAGAWVGKVTTERAPTLTRQILSSDRVREFIARRMHDGTTPPSRPVSRIAVMIGRTARRALGPDAA